MTLQGAYPRRPGCSSYRFSLKREEGGPLPRAQSSISSSLEIPDKRPSKDDATARHTLICAGIRIEVLTLVVTAYAPCKAMVG